MHFRIFIPAPDTGTPDDARLFAFGVISPFGEDTTNPQAFWDWFEVGGRWSHVFLVKNDCANIIKGEHYHVTENEEQLDRPEGYKWVAGAKKKDIEWDLMKELAIEIATISQKNGI